MTECICKQGAESLSAEQVTSCVAGGVCDDPQGPQELTTLVENHIWLQKQLWRLPALADHKVAI